MPVPFPADRTFITPALVRLRAGGEVDPNVFTRWRREGRVEKLRNGLYLNAQADLRGEAGLYAVANHLLAPSYVSLHAALHYWDLVPEAVYEVTSVTTRPTRMLYRGHQRFSYRQLSPKLFFGYETVEWQYDTYLVARPEKALIDYAYFYPEMDDPDYVYEMRFDEQFVHKELDWELMERYLRQIGSAALTRRMRLLRKVELL